MKKTVYLYIYMLLALFAFGACHSEHHHHAEAEHHEEGHHHSEAEEHEMHKEHDAHDAHDAHDEGHSLDEIVMSHHQMEDARLAVDTVRRASFSEIIVASGQILASQGDERTVIASSDGVVNFSGRNFSEGVHVNRGDIICRISAESILGGDAARKLQMECDVAKQAYERAKALAADQIISQRDLDEARLRYESAHEAHAALVEGGKNGVAVAAPMGGFIKTRLVNSGDYVSIGQPICIVTQNQRLQLRADVPVRYFERLGGITGANFRPAGSDSVYALARLGGRLLSYGRNQRDGSAYVPMTFEFSNVGRFLSGTFAEVWLTGGERQGVISVPIEAITESQGLKFVYVRIGDHSFMRREVTTGATDGRRVEICAGLEPGECVVTRGAIQVRLASQSGAVPEGHSHNH